MKRPRQFGSADLDESKKGMATSGGIKAEAEGDLTVTSKDLAGDEETKANLHSNCIEKAQDFEAETKSRGEELKALAEAKKAIQEATGGAEAQSYSLMQLGSGFSSGADLARFEAVRFVQDLAQKQNSPRWRSLRCRWLQ